jgi:hypothetical protein
MTDQQQDGLADLATFTDDLIERCRWARTCNGRRPAPGWSTLDKIAVYLVMEDQTALATAGFDTETASEWIAGEILDPPTDLDVWLNHIRAEMLGGDPTALPG